METISLARGVPAAECVPAAELADCARAAITEDADRVLSYGSGAGYAPLRRWIADRHGVATERVVLTNGSLQGFALLAQVLAARGERVLVEAPTYDRPLKILGSLGADVDAVACDDGGLVVDELERALRRGRRPAFLYLLPTFQNPTGRTLSLERRRRVAALAAEYDVLVLEDDPYGSIRFDGEPQPTLFELDGGSHVGYSSSFSKTVAAGLRVGYLVLPERVARAVESLAASTYISPALLSQATVFEFLRRGHLERNVALVRSLLRARRDALLGALEDQLGRSGARWNRPQGGYFLWLELPSGSNARALLHAAAGAGVSFVAGPDFYPWAGGGSTAARLAFSQASPPQLVEAVRRLARLVAPLAPVELREQHAA
ncbi:MAG: PLP-dependent aminotransferase family protein [Actinomycetota bacterium]|nr:PLP-dependent aminotransferase family protein [Actinomycetota bacterium]